MQVILVPTVKDTTEFDGTLASYYTRNIAQAHDESSRRKLFQKAQAAFKQFNTIYTK